MEFILGLLIGGLLFWLFFERKKPSGTFVIDLTDPAKDVCRLEFDESLNSIYTKKRIVFNVKVFEDNSLK